MATFPFELVSPERLLFSGEVEGVVVPGTEGDFMVLKDHAPLMSALRPGVIEIDETTTSKSKLFVRGGFADVSPRGLTILAEVAIPLAELDSAALDQQIKDLQEDVDDAQADDARRLASEKLAHMQELRAALKM